MNNNAFDFVIGRANPPVQGTTHHATIRVPMSAADLTLHSKPLVLPRGCKPYHRSRVIISLRDNNDSPILPQEVPMQESESILSNGNLSGIDVGIVRV